MHEVDINRPETLRNSHVDVPQWFQDELIRIGGRTLAGFPVLRAVWGQSEFVFACGQLIPKYRSGVVKETKTVRFRLRNIHTNETKECTYHEAKVVWERLQENEDEQFISEKYSHLELEPVGLPRFVIEQYIPPEKIKDTPEGWERNRYKLFSPHPSIAEVKTDIIGPFPFDGRYESFLIVKEDDGTRFGKFRPLGRDIVGEVERAWARRNGWKRVKSDELMVKDIFEAAQEKERRDEAETTARLNDALLPMRFKGRTVATIRNGRVEVND